MLLSCVSLYVSCGKTVDTPNSEDKGTIIGGVTSSFKDTVSFVSNNITIKYSKTSQCFPSNEIFAFTATPASNLSNATFNWEFGDGQMMQGTSVRNIYEHAGNYTVILKVKDASGQLLNAISFSIEAYGQQVTPHASFYAQIYDINYLNNYAFTSQSTVQRGTLTNYTWDWADGSSTSTANAYTPHNFPQVAEDKTYPVKLIATANSGCKDTAIVSVYVPAVYSISGDFDAVRYDACNNEYFIFTPNIKGAPNNATFSWDFADASGTAIGAPIKKAFTYQNNYDVKMTVYLNGKQIYKVSKNVLAYGQNIKPKALMLKNVVSSDATTVKWAFYSQSNIPHGYFTGYLWDLGGGVIDDNFNTYVEKTFQKSTTAATYSVKLVVTGNSGCKDTATAIVTIPAK